jgi:hypothetical protein
MLCENARFKYNGIAEMRGKLIQEQGNLAEALVPVPAFRHISQAEAIEDMLMNELSLPPCRG